MSASPELGCVEVEDRRGQVYTLPLMNITEARQVLPPSGRTPAGAPTLLLVNSAMVTLSVPFRIIKEVRVDSKVVWCVS